MFYSTVDWGGPPSLRSIAKYTWHTDKDICWSSVETTMNRASLRRQTVRGRKGVDWRGAVWWDAALLVVPSKWIPPWICIGRSRNWIHMDTDRGCIGSHASRRTEAKNGSFSERGARALCRTWRLSRPSIEGKRKTGRGVTAFSTASFLCTPGNFV